MASEISCELSTRLLDRVQCARHQPRRIGMVGDFAVSVTETIQLIYAEAIIVHTNHLDDLLSRNTSELSEFDDDEDALDLLVCNGIPFNRTDNTVLQSCYDAISPGGLFVFSCFGPDSFQEARVMMQDEGQALIDLSTIDMHDLGDMLLSARFEDPVVDKEEIIFSYQEIDLFQRDLVQCVETLENVELDVGDLSKSGVDLPLTVELNVALAWKPIESVMRASDDTEVWVPISDISKR